MKLNDLAGEVYARVGLLTRDEVGECVRIVNRAIAEAVQQGREVYIQGFARIKDGRVYPTYKRAHRSKQRRK